jgi:hypothetical protein
MSLPEKDTSPEEIVVTPDLLQEGESKWSTLPIGNESDSSKRKHVEGENVPPDLDQSQKMCGI